VSLVNVSLDLLSDTRALDPQAMLHTVCQAVFRALGRLGQELLDAVLARQLDELRLPPLRVYRVLPLSCHGMLVEAEGVRPLLLIGGRLGGGALGENGGGRPARKEALQRRRQRLGQLHEVRRRSHDGGDRLTA